MARHGMKPDVARIVKAIAPLTAELAEVRSLLDAVHDAVLAAAVAGRTDKRSLEALIADLRETVKAWQ
jgi:hypothetical protein